jgi:hypothetical protein
MGFIKFVYDGTSGITQEKEGIFTVVKHKRVEYLVNSQQGVYRVVYANKDTEDALATIVKRSDVVDKVKSKYFKGLDRKLEKITTGKNYGKGLTLEDFFEQEE